MNVGPFEQAYSGNPDLTKYLPCSGLFMVPLCPHCQGRFVICIWYMQLDHLVWFLLLWLIVLLVLKSALMLEPMPENK